MINLLLWYPLTSLSLTPFRPPSLSLQFDGKLRISERLKRYSVPVRLVDETVARVYANSPLGVSEMGTSHVTLR